MSHVRTGARWCLSAIFCLGMLLFLLGAAALGVSAMTTVPDSGNRYTLTLQCELYDDVGERGLIGIRTELSAGSPILVESIVESYPSAAAILKDFILEDSMPGMPADGMMPDADLTITLSYVMKPFTVTWMVDGVVISEQVKYGEIPVYRGDTPEKAMDAKYIYTFAGWDKAASATYGDVTYTARFDKTLRTYTVTFLYGDGKTATETVRYGYAVDAPTDTELADTVEWNYTFEGWDHSLEAITGDTTVTAQYSREKQRYTVTFQYGDGKVTRVDTPYGEAAVPPTDLSKPSTVEWDYTFEAWDAPIDNITGPLTVNAIYSQSKRKYTVTFVYGDDEHHAVQVEYGAGATAPTDTDKTSSAEWHYTFDGWDKAYDRITGDTTVTALYKQEKRSYTVTFVYGDGKTKTETVLYGTAATPPTDTERADTVEWDYTFDKWDKSFDKITGDTTVTAVYKQEKQRYTVTFLYGDGQTTKVETPYGEAAKAPQDTAKASTAEWNYVFEKWDTAFDRITKAITVTAVYKQEVRTYRVTFQYGDGKTETVEVPYGEAATAPTDTDKAADGAYSYTFTGWDVAFDKVTGDMTIKALYDKTPIAGADTGEQTTGGEPTEGTTPEGETVEPSESGDSSEDSSDNSSESGTNPPEPGTGTQETDTPRPPETAPDGSIIGTDGGSDTADGASGGCGGSFWWVLILLLVVAAAAAAFLWYRKQSADADHDDNTPPPTAPAPEADKTEEKAAKQAADKPAEKKPASQKPTEKKPAETKAQPKPVVTVLASVTADMVDGLMTDKAAEDLLAHSSEEPGSGKMGIVNIGAISAACEPGEVVTLATLQAKGLVAGNVGRLKILASGTLDKPLTVKAGAFSLQAIKMILLTGGHAVKLGEK